MIFRDKWNHFCAANNHRGTFDQCSPAVKALYFVPIACQCMLANCRANIQRPIWSAYVLCITVPTQICINVLTQKCVCPHQVSHCVRTFDALLRNNLYRFFYMMRIFIHLFCLFASNVWCFLQFFIFPQLFNALVWWRPNVVVVGDCFGFRIL